MMTVIKLIYISLQLTQVEGTKLEWQPRAAAAPAGRQLRRCRPKITDNKSDNNKNNIPSFNNLPTQATLKSTCPHRGPVRMYVPTTTYLLSFSR